MATMDEIKARGSPVFLTYQLCCASYLVVLALTYGTLIVYNPSFQIEDFYVPALNKALNSTADTDTTLIFFNLIIQNEMVNVGFRYDAVNLTFSYAPNTSTTMVLGTYTVPGFYQGMKKKARRRDVAIVPWKEAAGSDFRLDVATHAKLKNWFWYFKHTRITAVGTVKVDDSGKKQTRDSVDLQSRNNPSPVRVVFWALGFIILILVGVSFIVFGVLYGFQISGYRPT